VQGTSHEWGCLTRVGVPHMSGVPVTCVMVRCDVETCDGEMVLVSRMSVT
jgi:hypothetical protein